MNRFVLPTIAIAFLGAGLLAMSQRNDFNLTPIKSIVAEESALVKPLATTKPEVIDPKADLPNQPRLANPPKVIKAAYATSWSGGSTAKMDYLINLIKSTELNAIVLDIKDFSGTVSYDIKLPDVIKYKAKQIRIPKINALIKRLHDENIYVIGRVTVFEDTILATARPDLAIKDISTGKVWVNSGGLAWVDPGSQEVWKYNLAIAQDATERGFDEINFDYVRFPSDGKLSLMDFPHSDLTKEKKSDVIKRFFEYVRANMSNTKTSADVFGLTVIATDDMGIGQIIEYAFENFDYVAPMIYPSHFASGYIGYKNPADHPYAVIQDAMQNAYNRLLTHNSKAEARSLSADATAQASVPVAEHNLSKLRPWLQSFDLGATYDATKIRDQIKATTDSLCKFTYKTEVNPTTQKKTTTKSCVALSQADSEKIYGGWMLWDPRNNYIKSSLEAAK